MMLRRAALASLLATSHAWLPTEDKILSRRGSLSKRRLPSFGKVRGVNLGSQFIVERWMAEDSWAAIGCSDYNDEWACTEAIGQEAADVGFDTHWDTWTTEADIAEIASLNLNTVRIPMGYWIYEDLVHDDEYFPRGGLKYLDRLMGWCKEHGLYVILDLHGGPGAQSPNEQFTGHSVPDPAFYTPENYERALKWLEFMTERAHTHENYPTVGMIQVMNEPVHVPAWADEAADMVENFYPAAYTRIQEVEDSLGVADEDRMHIQFMGTSWGSGDPREYLPSTKLAWFDAHRYLSFDSRIEQTKAGYIETACSDYMGENVYVGEWSLSVNSTLKNTEEFTIINQETWYHSYWAAQAQSFEKSDGWIYWSWKCDGTDDWRWCYQQAVEAGAIPDDATSADTYSPC